MGFTTSPVERREEIDPPHVWWEPEEGHHTSALQTDGRLEMGNLYSKRDDYSVQVVGYVRARSRCTND